MGRIKELTEKLDMVDLQYRLLRLNDINQLSDAKNRSDKYTVLTYIMELGLHSVPKTLEIKVYETINLLIHFSSGILLFYGLCGNVLGKVEEDFCLEEDDCIIRILRDDVRIMDDYIGACQFMERTTGYR